MYLDKLNWKQRRNNKCSPASDGVGVTSHQQASLFAGRLLYYCKIAPSPISLYQIQYINYLSDLLISSDSREKFLTIPNFIDERRDLLQFYDVLWGASSSKRLATRGLPIDLFLMNAFRKLRCDDKGVARRLGSCYREPISGRHRSVAGECDAIIARYICRRPRPSCKPASAHALIAINRDATTTVQFLLII